jgi:hypothetical protein
MVSLPSSWPVSLTWNLRCEEDERLQHDESEQLRFDEGENLHCDRDERDGTE